MGDTFGGGMQPSPRWERQPFDCDECAKKDAALDAAEELAEMAESGGNLDAYIDRFRTRAKEAKPDG